MYLCVYNVWLVLLYICRNHLAKPLIVRNLQRSVAYMTELVLESLKLIQHMQGPIVKGLRASYFQCALVVEVSRFHHFCFFEVGAFLGYSCLGL